MNVLLVIFGVIFLFMIVLPDEYFHNFLGLSLFVLIVGWFSWAVAGLVGGISALAVFVVMTLLVLL